MFLRLTAIVFIASALAQAPQREYDRPEEVAGGVALRERRFMRGSEGPFTMHVLEVDPADPRVNLLPVRARDRMAGRETVSSMARRYGAVAAVNGGYFVMWGPYAGASLGASQFDGRPQASGSGQTALLFCEETGFVERLEMDVVEFRGLVTAGGAATAIAGLNRRREAPDMVAYLPELGPATMTGGSGVEVVLDANSRVAAVEEGGNAAIPVDGTVLSGTGPGADWLRAHARPGAPMTVRLELNRTTPGCRAVDIVGGGPRLVRNGRVAVAEEGFKHPLQRHPRTAVAVTRRGTILFVTVDGRRSSSAGMRLDEFASELVSLGAVDAMNFDGGGSTTMVVGNRVRNSPSDGIEREVGDAILVFSTGTPAELAALVERLGADPAHIGPSALAAIREKLRAGAVEEIAALANAPGVSAAAARLLREAVHGAAGEPVRR